MSRLRAVRRVEPGPGQESVWDYPRPPRLEKSNQHVQVRFNGETIAESRQTYRVLETSHPPVYYIPPEDIRMALLRRSPGQSYCEWKGVASYHTLTVGDRVALSVAWSYSRPSPAFAPIAHYLAFYPSKIDACFVDGVHVKAQPGDFYGGWITPDIVGPFKGDPGTVGW